MTDKSSLSFYGGVGGATGANFLFSIVRTNEKPLRVLVDCGLFQGDRFAGEENRKAFAYDPASIDALFVTHAHSDHIGRIPKLAKEGFRGSIYSTPETREIAILMFDDALAIMRRESSDRKETMLYEHDDVARALLQWKTVGYDVPLEISAGVTVVARDAGHILGSAYFVFARDGKRIVFSGDLGNSPSLLLRDTQPLERADYLLMESVYGDRNHEDKSRRRENLKQAVLRAIRQKGVLVIPAFSLERSQMILYELNKLVENGSLPAIPVFLDSPLAIKVTAVYRKMKHDFKKSVQSEIASGDDIFNFPRLKFTVSHQESQKIDLVQNPKIIIAGGGMSEGGRVIGHEKNYLPDPKATVLLVGYQAAGTLGRRLLEGVDEVTIVGETVPVRAKILSVMGYSSHKDSDHLVEWVSTSADTLKKVFVCMGEPRASMFLAQRIKEELGVGAIYPELGSTIEVEF